MSSASSQDANQKNVGILAVEVYTPFTFISQDKLEDYYGVDKGKYTVGLGQDGLAVCGDVEDVNSLALTVVQSLLEKYKILPSEIGRLEVGTETLVDKSKSTKTVLMELFGDNTDVEGATVINACYGGTAALLNAFSWVESDGWDGRFAIVVAADIAVYASGNARPTSGAGAVAVLVGRDAPLAFLPKLKATHASHVWDFFKPDHNVEYPTVNGALSQLCYYKALEDCYHRFAEKMEKFYMKDPSRPLFDAETPDFFAFHAPYNKLVQKSYARLFLTDAKRKFDTIVKERENESIENHNSTSHETTCKSDDVIDGPLQKWLTIPQDQTYSDRDLENVLKKLSASSYQKRLSDANYASQKIGNTYTASVFMGLASLIDRAGRRGDLTAGKSICVFSYGSGALATMYLLTIRNTEQDRFTVPVMVGALDLTNRLDSRKQLHPQELDLALDTRARMHRMGAPYTPIYPTEGWLFPGTFYLKSISSDWTRHYARLPLTVPAHNSYNSSFTPDCVEIMPKIEFRNEVTSADRSTKEVKHHRRDCVITGISCGLPGDGPVFRSDNLARLIAGEQCIKPIKENVKIALLDKNVIQISKARDGSIQKVPVNTELNIIKLAAQLGKIDLHQDYGVLPGLAETMDVAAQVAVAAGLEALKSAGLVTGRTNDPKEWMLDEKYRDRTGIVYASSFPAMDAAIGEVMKFLQSKTVDKMESEKLISLLKKRIIDAGGELSDADEAAFAHLFNLAAQSRESDSNAKDQTHYLFDRKFLFRVLVLGNAQLAQLTGCRGPNAQTNAACAGTTQAIAMAQDMISSGRADRVVVIAGDNASGDTLLPWLGSGFRVLGAACTASTVENAALPFDKRRSGMLIGAGGIGMVLETDKSYMDRRHLIGTISSFNVKARLLATQYSNSAFHGASLDRKHIASELKRFLNDVEITYGVKKEDIATSGVYLSHETSTHASPETSCAANEIGALREAFGDELLCKLLILNTKGYTGHPMGVSFEDVAAVEVLFCQRVPPVANYFAKDEHLGNINISCGGPYKCRYALRFAAGFGSQVAFALYAAA